MKYRDLSYLIGETVKLKEPAKPEPNIDPERVIVLNVYEDTVLIEKVFRYSSYKRMLTKAALYCGDARMFWHGHQITGAEVRA